SDSVFLPFALSGVTITFPLWIGSFPVSAIGTSVIFKLESNALINGTSKRVFPCLLPASGGGVTRIPGLPLPQYNYTVQIMCRAQGYGARPLNLSVWFCQNGDLSGDCFPVTSTCTGPNCPSGGMQHKPSYLEINNQAN